MNKKWTRYVPVVVALVAGVAFGFIGKASADGSIHSYIGCTLPK